MLYGHNGINGMEMKLRYSISPKTQVIYIHGHEPELLYVEYEGNFPAIWAVCDTQAHQYPRLIEVLPLGVPYIGQGRRIPNYTPGPWEFYDAGPSTTDAFNLARLPNVAPYNPINTHTQGDTQ